MWNRNKIDLIKILINNDVTSIDQLSIALNLKKRAIYFHIEEINDLLKKSSANIIKNKWNKGFTFDGDFEVVEKLLEDEFYLFSYEERFNYMCFDILTSPSSNKKTFDYYANLFEVSRNTIFLDVQKATNLMKKFDLKFYFDKGKRMFIEGEEIKKRCFLINYVSNFIIYNEDFVVKKLFKIKDIKNCEIIDITKKIIDSFKTVNLYINENYFKFLISYLSVLKKYYLKKSYIDIPNYAVEDIKKSVYWDMCKDLFKYFFHDQKGLDNEKCYLVILMTMGVLGENTNFYRKLTKKDIDISQNLKNVVEKFINKIEVNALIFFNDKESLVKEITDHILRSYVRIKYLLVDLEYVKVIKKEYENIFNAVKSNIKVLSDFLNLKIFDDEVALISLYFVSDLFANRNKKIKTALILNSPINVGAITKKQLEHWFGNLSIDNISDIKEFLKVKDNYDLILSSVELLDDVNYFKIDKILSDTDKNSIEKKIKNIVKNKKDPKKIHHQNFFHSECFSSVDKVINNWKDVVIESCDLLLNQEKIDENFVDSIITNLQEFQDIHKLSNDAIMLFGHFSNKCNEVNYGFTFFKKPVSFFNKNEKIKFVLVLVPIDNESHLDSYKVIQEMFKDKSFISKLEKCDDIKNIKELVLGYKK